MSVNTILAQPRLITVEEYEQMIQAGVFPEDDRIELISGQLVAMSPIGSLHASQIKRLIRLLSALIKDQATLDVQDPIRLPGSEPQPDIALLVPRPDDYASGHPTASEVLLVIEVADTSADYDRNVKIPLYGRAGITEAWLIELDQATIEVYRGPSRTGYNEKHTYAPGDRIAPYALPELSLAVAEVLGPQSA